MVSNASDVFNIWYKNVHALLNHHFLKEGSTHLACIQAVSPAKADTSQGKANHTFISTNRYE